MWIATCTPEASATRRLRSITAGVVPQSSWSLKPDGARAQLLPEPLLAHRVALAEQRDVDRPVVERLEHALEIPGAGDGGGLGAVGRAGAAADDRGDAGAERLVELLRADEVHVAVDRTGGEDLAVARTGSRSTARSTSAGWTPSIVSGLPALPMPTMRPSRTPMSALTMPQWSRITAPVITRSGAPDVPLAARVAMPWPIDSRMTLPPPNTTSSPPAQWSSVTSMNRPVSASRMRSPVVGPYRARYRSRPTKLTRRSRSCRGVRRRGRGGRGSPARR